MFIKDIIDSDTLLLSVIHTQLASFGNMVSSRGVDRKYRIFPSILKQSSNREADWTRDRSSWNNYVNTFPLSVSPSNYSQDAGDDSCPMETSNAGINLTLWYLIPAPPARTRRTVERLGTPAGKKKLFTLLFDAPDLTSTGAWLGEVGPLNSGGGFT